MAQVLRLPVLAQAAAVAEAPPAARKVLSHDKCGLLRILPGRRIHPDHVHAALHASAGAAKALPLGMAALACCQILWQRLQQKRVCVSAPSEQGSVAERRYDGAGVSVEVALEGDRYEVTVTADSPRPMVLHWAINDWNLAPEEARPRGTVQVKPA